MRPFPESAKGILRPHVGAEHFSLARYEPADDLAAFVERYWLVRWDLRGKPAYASETLPYPCVNMVVEEQTAAVWGPWTAKFTRMLEGEGFALGTKFFPGGFYPFVGSDMDALTDRATPVAEIFGPDAVRPLQSIARTTEDVTAVEIVETFLRSLHPQQSPDALRANEIVKLVASDRSILRTDDLAKKAGESARTLQRLFKRVVGVSPKWTIRRFRLQEAADRIAHGTAVDGAALAQELGYFDQAHFIHDFRSQIGATPSEYAASCGRAT